MYKVTIEVYENVAGKKEVESFYKDYEHALVAYHTASRMTDILQWTRHYAINSEVSHMSEKKNIFNEGAILLESVEVDEPGLM
jgi:hypothetical protein